MKLLNWCNSQSLMRPPLRAYCLSRARSSSATPAPSEENIIDNEVTKESTELNASLTDMRDVSRMPSQYRDRMLHVMKPPEPPSYYDSLFQTLEQRRKLYGKFGRRSGYDPGIMWPTQEELKDMVEFEAEWEPSLQARWKKLRDEREQEEKERREKNELVEKAMAKMPKLIDEYRARLSKADEIEQKQEEKRRALREEARDFFGYELHKNDPRFEQMQLSKEEEEKKQQKKKKKEDKLAKLSKLLQS